MTIEATMGKWKPRFFRNEMENVEGAGFRMRERGGNEENFFLTKHARFWDSS